MLIGGVLVQHGGLPILTLGALSVLAGWGYSGGTRPIAYGPLVDLLQTDRKAGKKTTEARGPACNRLLLQSAQLEGAFGLADCIGWAA